MQEVGGLLELFFQQGGDTSAFITVTGSSMVPILRHMRDRVCLEPPGRPLHRGDVALYRRESGQYVLHRIVRMDAVDCLVCCGDHQWKTETIHPEQIIGLVCGFERDGKLWSVRNIGYRLYTWLWVRMLPIRWPILALRRRLGAYRRKRPAILQR